jgi:hypothetical protein
MSPLVVVITIIVIFIIFKLSKKSSSKYGTQYAKKLGLSFKEVSHLNSINNIPWENFAYLDFCATEVIRLYISTIRNFPELIKKKNIKKEQDLSLRYCIWQVRNKYDYKFTRFQMSEESIKAIPAEIKAFIDSLAETILTLTEKQERKLCDYDSSRWKRKFEQLIKSYPKDSEAFYNEILQLVSCFSQVTSKRAIYHHAHLFMVDKNKEISAMFYIYYLSIKSKSDTFKFTGINAKNKKILFRDKKQETEFERIIENFKVDNNSEKALKATKELFTIKRKTVQLNTEDIDKAQQEYNMAVGILNEYLIDEELPEMVTKASFLSEYSDNNAQFLELFVLNGYKLDKKEVDKFAEKQGTFASQFVNNINETYYEELNDILIEETDDCFTIDETYYRKIVQ